jgi:hypothetical protein
VAKSHRLPPVNVILSQLGLEPKSLSNGSPGRLGRGGLQERQPTGHAAPSQRGSQGKSRLVDEIRRLGDIRSTSEALRAGIMHRRES